MQNSEDNIEKVSKTKVSEQKNFKSLFSEREIRTIIRDFIDAYIAGQVKIVFPDAQTIIFVHKSEGKEIAPGQAEVVARKLRVDFMHAIAICAGTEEATSEERQVATNEVFRNIISWRNSRRIEGTFHEYKTEARLCNLEEGMEKINKLLEEIVDYIMKGN